MKEGFYLIFLIVYFCIFGIPIMQILKRVGHSRAWVLIMLVPLVNLVFLWIFAFKRWPVEG
jgi:hypothetical protein